MASDRDIVPMTRIESRILYLRENKVILDADLADLYGVKTRVLVQAVKRNIARFPDDFMLQLTREEFDVLRSQFVTSKNQGRGGRRYLPYASAGTRSQASRTGEGAPGARPARRHHDPPSLTRTSSCMLMFAVRPCSPARSKAPSPRFPICSFSNSMKPPASPLTMWWKFPIYFAALDHGLKRLMEDFPLSNRLIREIHGKLLSRGRAEETRHFHTFG